MFVLNAVFGAGYNFPLVWIPYDDHGLVSDPFFSQHPRKIFEKGQFNAVPTMIGMTRDEGLLRSHAFYQNKDLFEYFWYVVYNLYAFIKLELLIANVILWKLHEKNI